MATDERIKEIIAEQLGIEPSKVTDDAHIYDDLGADSLDQVELIMLFEEEYDIEISESETERYLVVSDIIAKIKEKAN